MALEGHVICFTVGEQTLVSNIKKVGERVKIHTKAIVLLWI